MANAGPNTNGSQFFIVHKDAGLPHSYTIFGKVTEGMDAVDSIASSDTDNSDRPHHDVVINKVTIAEE
jgi:cyclophilin family peptidyl-prolyl cis-trans isomerase